MQPERLVTTSKSLDVDYMKHSAREDPKSTEYCVTGVGEKKRRDGLEVRDVVWSRWAGTRRTTATWRLPGPGWDKKVTGAKLWKLISGSVDRKHAKVDAHYWAYVTMGFRWLKTSVRQSRFHLLHFLAGKPVGELLSQLGTVAQTFCLEGDEPQLLFCALPRHQYGSVGCHTAVISSETKPIQQPGPQPRSR